MKTAFLRECLLPAFTHFFKDIVKHTFTVCDTTQIEIPQSINRAIFFLPDFVKNNRLLVAQVNIKSGYKGILFLGGKVIRELDAGQYFYFGAGNPLEIKEVDLKKRLVQISGQELLTADKVELRINFAVTLRTIDALRAMTEFKEYEEQLYLLFQLSLREFISTKTLDEILAQKHELGALILEHLKTKEDSYAAEFLEAGIKDIILPGEVKDILNTVLIAEKRAMANVITRREETASTRSLLNTAKLMEENQTLYKLKELEYLEKICDKVGSISLGNGNVLEQLGQLINHK